MTKTSPTPRLVVLCGKPTSGKTTAAEIISEAYGYEIHDDGAPLREIAMTYFGLTKAQVTTQEGKLEEISVNGRPMTVRQLLGEIGEAFEDKFGANTVPLMSLSRMNPETRYVMPSVRHDQATFWKNQGALVIEIDRPGTEPSPYAFDRYSRAAVDITVLNDPSPDFDDDDLLRLAARMDEALTRDRP